MFIDFSYFQNEVMVALTGRCVFEGVFYEKVHRFDVRMEHLVSGPDSDEVFCILLRRSIHYFTSCLPCAIVEISFIYVDISNMEIVKNKA